MEAVTVGERGGGSEEFRAAAVEVGEGAVSVVAVPLGDTNATLHRLIATARRLLIESARLTPGRARLRVYRRTGRACPRCGTAIRSAPLAAELPRTTYWCPRCQAAKVTGS